MGRVGVQTGEVMAVLVTNTDRVPHLKELTHMLKEAIPGFVTLVQNVNTRHTNVIMGPHNKVIYGPGVIHDRLGDLTFVISPHSFFQVNTLQAQRLYETALSYAALEGKENVIDLYCGTGTITLFSPKRHGTPWESRLSHQRLLTPEKCPGQSHQNSEFICADAAKELPLLVRDGIRPDVVVLDPPRAGCERPVLDAILAVRPKRVVYVSCGPASLARDAAILCEGGYNIRQVQPVDMFPHTSHVETVVLMSRVQK